jgi:hypothetical protein
MARGVKSTPELLPLPQAHALVHQIAPAVPLFSLTRVYWRTRHRVPTVRVGRFLYFPRAELTAWAEEFAKSNR